MRDRNRVFRVMVALGTGVALAAITIIGFTKPAEALPSFARQTGQPCGTCHTDFPALTPFGRRFKLLGYTVAVAEFRTTPCPSFPPSSDSPAQADKMPAYAKAVDSGKSDSD